MKGRRVAEEERWARNELGRFPTGFFTGGRLKSGVQWWEYWGAVQQEDPKGEAQQEAVGAAWAAQNQGADRMKEQRILRWRIWVRSACRTGWAGERGVKRRRGQGLGGTAWGPQFRIERGQKCWPPPTTKITLK